MLPVWVERKRADHDPSSFSRQRADAYAGDVKFYPYLAIIANIYKIIDPIQYIEKL